METDFKLFLWRGISDALLIIAALYLQWWLVLLCSCLLFFVFDTFVEIFLAALFMDLLYGSPLSRFGDFQFILSLGALCVFVLLTVAKKRMRIYTLN